MVATLETVALFNALPFPCLLLSPDLLVEAASDAYLRATLSCREQLVGQHLFAAFPDNPLTPQANSVHNLRASLRQVLATRQPHEMAQQHYDVPDPAHPGQFVERHWQPLNAPVLDAQGTVVQLIHTVRDVTAEVHSQAFLRASQAATQAAQTEVERQHQRFYDVLLQLPAHVAVHEGPDQVFTLVNPGYQRLAPDRALLGQPIRVVWPELVSQGILDVLDQVYRSGEPFIGKERPFQVDFTRTGQVEQVYLNAFFLPLRDAQGQVHGVLDFSYDVTEQVLARQQLVVLNAELYATNATLQTTNQQLRRTNNDLDTFVYMASHDLKAPITNVEGLLEALRETLPPGVPQQPLVAQLLGLLDRTVGRFQTTIDQLTTLGRLQRTVDEPAESLALAPVVAGVIEDLTSLIRGAAAQLQVDIPAGLHVSFPAASLRSVVYNLLSNAVKYRDAARPAQVWLHAEQQAGAVVLRVRDNGLGLTDSQQRRLFGVFERLHTHVEGTGVGLYMIKRLIENAGGHIAVASTVGVGSTFTVTFPR